MIISAGECKGITAMSAPKHRPFVPENAKMKEFSLGALLLGLAMTVVLGAANAYLGCARA